MVANHPVPGVPEKQLILAESSHRAMVRMGANYRMLFDPVMIGVTGSVEDHHQGVLLRGFGGVWARDQD